jgi:small subunit ribosomal protein S4
MARDMVPVLKRCRSLGLEPSYLGYDKKSNRELKRANKKISEYGLQLREKQKAKFIYGVLEKPFRNYYEKADRMKGLTGPNLMTMLESRLDNVVFRLGFARTRREARQIVDHKFVTVNGNVVNIPSYALKVGDVVSVREKSKTLEVITDALSGAARSRYAWLEWDNATMSGKYLQTPEREEIPENIKEQLIVELYSK